MPFVGSVPDREGKSWGSGGEMGSGDVGVVSRARGVEMGVGGGGKPAAFVCREGNKDVVPSTTVHTLPTRLHLDDDKRATLTSL